MAARVRFRARALARFNSNEATRLYASTTPTTMTTATKMRISSACRRASQQATSEDGGGGGGGDDDDDDDDEFANAPPPSFLVADGEWRRRLRLCGRRKAKSGSSSDNDDDDDDAGWLFILVEWASERSIESQCAAAAATARRNELRHPRAALFAFCARALKCFVRFRRRRSSGAAQQTMPQLARICASANTTIVSTASALEDARTFLALRHRTHTHERARARARASELRQSATSLISQYAACVKKELLVTAFLFCFVSLRFRSQLVCLRAH